MDQEPTVNPPAASVAAVLASDSIEAEPEQRTISAQEMILTDGDALPRQRMAELLAPIGESSDLPANPKAALIVKASKMRADHELIIIAKSL